MTFLAVFAGAWVGAYLLRKPLHKLPLLFYAIAVALGVVGLFGMSAGLPRAVWRLLFELQREALLPLALFSVVMFMGCFRKDSFVGRSLLPVRGELSIIAWILSLEHVVVYLKAYLPRVLGASAVPTSVLGGFAIAVVLLALLLVLGVTSFKLVRRAMPSKVWKAVQRLSYPFFALVFVHVLLMLAPSAINGGVAAQVSLVVYVALFGLYLALRAGRYLGDRRDRCAQAARDAADAAWVPEPEDGALAA